MLTVFSLLRIKYKRIVARNREDQERKEIRIREGGIQELRGLHIRLMTGTGRPMG